MELTIVLNEIIEKLNSLRRSPSHTLSCFIMLSSLINTFCEYGLLSAYFCARFFVERTRNEQDIVPFLSELKISEFSEIGSE